MSAVIQCRHRRQRRRRHSPPPSSSPKAASRSTSSRRSPSLSRPRLRHLAAGQRPARVRRARRRGTTSAPPATRSTGLNLRAPGPDAPIIAQLPDVKTGGPEYPAAMGMHAPRPRPDPRSTTPPSSARTSTSAPRSPGFTQDDDGVDVFAQRRVGRPSTTCSSAPTACTPTVREQHRHRGRSPSRTGMGIWRAFVLAPRRRRPQTELYYGGPVYIAGYTPDRRGHRCTRSSSRRPQDRLRHLRRGGRRRSCSSESRAYGGPWNAIRARPREAARTRTTRGSRSTSCPTPWNRGRVVDHRRCRAQLPARRSRRAPRRPLEDALVLTELLRRARRRRPGRCGTSSTRAGCRARPRSSRHPSSSASGRSTASATPTSPGLMLRHRARRWRSPHERRTSHDDEPVTDVHAHLLLPAAAGRGRARAPRGVREAQALEARSATAPRASRCRAAMVGARIPKLTDARRAPRRDGRAGRRPCSGSARRRTTSTRGRPRSSRSGPRARRTALVAEHVAQAPDRLHRPRARAAAASAAHRRVPRRRRARPRARRRRDLVVRRRRRALGRAARAVLGARRGARRDRVPAPVRLQPRRAARPLLPLEHGRPAGRERGRAVAPDLLGRARPASGPARSSPRTAAATCPPPSDAPTTRGRCGPRRTDARDAAVVVPAQDLVRLARARPARAARAGRGRRRDRRCCSAATTRSTWASTTRSSACARPGCRTSRRARDPRRNAAGAAAGAAARRGARA